MSPVAVESSPELRPMSAQEVREAIVPLVGERGLLQGADMVAYEQGARYGQGHALCVVRPDSVEQLQAVVRWCVDHEVALLPQGANTGLVGASTPDASGAQVVLSTSRLRDRCDIDVDNRSVHVDAGFTLQELNERLQPHGLWFPIDLGANPSVGGMIAANTGGTRLIRYGDVRHNLLALEVVLLEPAGERLALGRALRKDNTGPDLKQLFVGTSGAGAIITGATLALHALPRQSATALAVPSSEADVLPLLQALEHSLGDYLSAFEGLSGRAMQAAIDHVPSLRNPFAPEGVPDLAILIELEATSDPLYTSLDLQDALNKFLQDQFENNTINNAVVGDGSDLWHLRHSLSEGARALGKPIAFDVSVPRSRIMDFCRAAHGVVNERMPFLKVLDFGHFADGGVHFNVIWPNDPARPYDAAEASALRERIYDLVVNEFSGSYSAEHGVGPHNFVYYCRYATAAERRLAKGLRDLTDPRRLCGVLDFGR